MTNDNNTRKKVNAVFFAAIMVLSMVAIGFAAAPAAADDDGPTLDKQPLHFVTQEDAGEFGDDTAVLELAFDAPINDTLGSFTIETAPGEDPVTIDIENNNDVFVDGDSGQVVVNTDALDEDGDGVFPRVGEITYEVAYEGETETNSGSADARFLGSTVTDNTDQSIFQGTQIAIENASVGFEAEISSDSEFAQRSSGDNSQVARFNTADRANEDYSVSGTDDFSAEFTLRDLGLTVTADSTEIDTNDDFTGDIEASASDRPVFVELLDNDGDEVASDTLSLDGDGGAEYEFGSVDDAGDYEVEATDLRSGVTVTSDTITVTEAADAEVEFDEQIVEENQGDLAEITINFEGDEDEAFLRIGGDDVGYEANISLSNVDEDQVTVLFNTYAAGDDELDGSVVSIYNEDDVDADVTLENQSTGIDGILDQGDYEMQLSGESFSDIDSDDADSLGTLVIEDRSTNDLNIWTAPEGDLSDLDDYEDLEAALEDGAVTESDTIAMDDAVIHQIDASGLEGVIETNDDFLDTLNFSDDDNVGFDLRVRQTRDTTGPNQDRLTANFSDTDFTNEISVIENEDNYYLAFETDDIEFTQDRQAEDGDEFDVRFRVKDERLLDPAEPEDFTSDDYDVLNAQFELVERDGTIDVADSDYVEVEADEDQEITGDTTTAPGSTFDVRIRSASGVSPGFIMTEEATVDGDRSWTTEGFDFSDAAVDDEFSVTVRENTASWTTSETGVVVDAAEEPAEDEGEATFELSNLDPETVEVEAGDVIAVSVDVENTGDAEGTQELYLDLDGQQLGVEEVTLDEGETTTITVEDIDTTGLEAGDYTHTFTSDDDEISGTLTVLGEETETPTEEPTEEPADDTGDDTADDTDDDTPGFGAVVALVALLAAALLATRRRP